MVNHASKNRPDSRLLSELADCDYCGLLQGKAVCHCDWRGYCAYENFHWQADSFARLPPDSIVAICPSPPTGLIIKPRMDLTSLPLGTIVSLRFPEDQDELSGVILRTYPVHGLAYIYCAGPCPRRLLTDRTLSIQAIGNAFSDHTLLNAVQNKRIILVGPASLEIPFRELTAALAAKGNSVERILQGATTSPSALADILLVAGPAEEVSTMITGLPPCPHIVTWITTSF